MAPTVSSIGRIDTMDVVEVNDIGFDPLQAALAARIDAHRGERRAYLLRFPRRRGD